MGHNSRQANVTLFLGALETCLLDLGLRIKPGAALAAASGAYRRAGDA
jgi:alanine-glyoxylate transaminase/serine-glyoxylate transaminase/serine-pyruvate transaminase